MTRQGEVAAHEQTAHGQGGGRGALLNALSPFNTQKSSSCSKRTGPAGFAAEQRPKRLKTKPERLGKQVMEFLRSIEGAIGEKELAEWRQRKHLDRQEEADGFCPAAPNGA